MEKSANLNRVLSSILTPKSSNNTSSIHLGRYHHAQCQADLITRNMQIENIHMLFLYLVLMHACMLMPNGNVHIKIILPLPHISICRVVPRQQFTPELAMCTNPSLQSVDGDIDGAILGQCRLAGAGKAPLIPREA